MNTDEVLWDLRLEKAYLDRKIFKGEAAIGKWQLDCLPGRAQFYLIKEQIIHMTNYSRILEARIRDLEGSEPVADSELLMDIISNLNKQEKING
jgi:hypothetical protein